MQRPLKNVSFYDWKQSVHCRSFKVVVSKLVNEAKVWSAIGIRVNHLEPTWRYFDKPVVPPCRCFRATSTAPLPSPACSRRLWALATFASFRSPGRTGSHFDSRCWAASMASTATVFLALGDSIEPYFERGLNYKNLSCVNIFFSLRRSRLIVCTATN